MWCMCFDYYFAHIEHRVICSIAYFCDSCYNDNQDGGKLHAVHGAFVTLCHPLLIDGFRCVPEAVSVNVKKSWNTRYNVLMLPALCAVTRALRQVQQAAPLARSFSSAAAATVGATAFRRLAVITPSLGLGAYVVTADEPKQIAYVAAFAPIRFARDVYAAVTILAGMYCAVFDRIQSN